METANPLDNLEIIARLREACGVEKDAQLARYLNITTSAISTWKTAVNAPFKACYDVHVKTGVSIEWLIKGTGAKFISNQNEIHSWQEGQVGLGNNIQPDPALSVSQDFFIKTFIESIDLGVKMGFFPELTEEAVNNLPYVARLIYSDTIGKARKEQEAKKSQ